jgi:hypothetical protein
MWPFSVEFPRFPSSGYQEGPPTERNHERTIKHLGCRLRSSCVRFVGFERRHLDCRGNVVWNKNLPPLSLPWCGLKISGVDLLSFSYPENF